MKDHAGRIIYVGKAVNLRERVRAYFGGGDPRAFVPLLDRVLGDIETVVVKNEKEALLLENTLVNRHKPRFNIKLRDGRNFIYLRLDLRQTYPRLEVTRQFRNDGARYFGPYPLASALRETLRVVNRHFQLRTCADHDAATHKGRPCLLCQISHFPAPSVYDIPPEEYRRHVNDAILFLEGRKTELIDTLRARMTQAAEALRFEEAARLRDRLEAIERTLEPQGIVGGKPIDQDAVGLHRQGDRLAIYMLYVRSGRVMGGRAFPSRGQAFPDAELLASFLNLYYAGDNFVPEEVLLPMAVDGVDTLATLLADRKGAPVRVLVPEQGGDLELVRMSIRNAREVLGAQHAPRIERAAVLERLKERLHLGRVPHRMECFDISHFHGGITVASQVAMTEGLPDKDRYRRYRITSTHVGDDFAAMYEVVSRRLRRGLETHDLPDLLVLDGGKGQLASAEAAMRDLGVHGVDVAALAKGREMAEGAPYEGGTLLPERIYLPRRKEPLVLPPDSPELLLLARLRDEAHRFAITYQRKLLRRERLYSDLDAIPGVGAKRKAALLRHFGSLHRIRAASVAELAGVEGMGPATAQRVYAGLHAAPGTETHAPPVHPG